MAESKATTPARSLNIAPKVETAAARPLGWQFAPDVLQSLEKGAKRLHRCIKRAQVHGIHPTVLREIADDFYAAIHTAKTVIVK